MIPSEKPLRVAVSGSTSSSPSRPPPRWNEYITLDLLLQVLHKTFLHPFIAWLIPLCLRAQATPYSHPSFIIAAAYATCLTAVIVLAAINNRIAHGPPRDVDLGEEVVVVAGGASGLGLVIAEMYEMRGVSVAVLDIKDMTANGDVRWDEMHSMEYYKCDLGDRTQVEKVAETINKELGTPTILINCVAAPINGLPLLSLPGNAIEKTLKANLLSYFHTLQVFLPGMLASPTGGTIVTLSSVLSYLTAAGLSDYTASKAAISAVHKTVEAELRLLKAGKRVKTLLVETGQIATPLFEDVETPNRFFAPVIEPVQVAREIVSMVDSGNGGVIRLPTFASFVGWYNVLPGSIQRLARFLSGIDTAVKGRFSESLDRINSFSNTSGVAETDSD